MTCRTCHMFIYIYIYVSYFGTLLKVLQEIVDLSDLSAFHLPVVTNVSHCTQIEPFKTSQCLFWGQNALNWMILLYINSYQLLSTPLDSRHCQILRMKFPALEMFQCHVATLPRGLPMSSGTFLWRSKDGRCRRRSWSRWSYLKNHTERRSPTHVLDISYVYFHYIIIIFLLYHIINQI